MASKNIVLAFDAYGTLLSTESIAKKLSEHFGQEKATTIAATWRKYQLEYTWRMNSMGTSRTHDRLGHPLTIRIGQYEDFSLITRRSLKHSLAESAVSLEDDQIEELMQAYDSLSIFPDVQECMEKLKSTPDIQAVVFSNGTHSMVSNSVNKSPDLKDYANIFQKIVVVEKVKKYKPAPEVYHHLARTVGKSQKQMDEIWLVSGNPFDVVGARAVGMNAIWVDRAGNGWQDELVQGDAGRPTKIVSSLEMVVPTVMAESSDTLTGQWREIHGERDT